ncbi:MAG: DAK2 domain-containing protein [Actinomycetes bacterium]
MGQHARQALDAEAVRAWCRLCVDQLARARTEIDGLNVFPVPDGDTGTNLFLTMEAASTAVDDTQAAGDDLVRTLRAMTQGALLGARGNSGVIVSQLLRGVAETLSTAAPAAPPSVVRAAFSTAADLGYAAVAHPVEGTVLTVARAAAEAAKAELADDLGAVVTAAVGGARRALALTPTQLEVLAKAGVVDAGGRGLVILLDALASVVTGSQPEALSEAPRREPRAAVDADEGRSFEVMFLLDAQGPAVEVMRERLDELGDSLVVVGGEGLWNVHVHVDDAGAAVEAGVRAGRPYRIRVTHLADAAAPRPGGRSRPGSANRGVVAVVPGAGLASLFESVGARPVIGGPGQRPSTATLLEAMRGCASLEVVLLPNDGDSLSVAEAAAERARDEGLRISVIPTRDPVQGLAAVAVHDRSRRFEDDVVAMTAAARATRHGAVSIAAREAITSAGVCRPGQSLGLIEGDVVVLGETLREVAVAVVDGMLAGAGELVTLVTGADVPDDLADDLVAHLHHERPDVEVVVYSGGQALYPMLIGVE